MTINQLFKGKKGLIAEVLIKKPPEEILSDDKEEIKIGLLGEESSGKSTLVS
jgi:GTPase SAR1 family protein